MTSPFVVKSVLGGLAACTVVAGGASVLYFYKGSSNTENLRSKFASALIEDTETTIGDAKGEAFKKGSANGDNKNLKLAFSKKDDSNSQDGKDALKRGCHELYDSVFKSREDKNFLDFQSYCSKNNKEKSGFNTGITQDHTDNAWVTKGSSLKTHTGDIDGELGAIKGKASVSGQDAERQKDRRT